VSGLRLRYHRGVQATGWIVCGVLAATATATAEPARRDRPYAVTAGLRLYAAGGGEPLPFLTVQGTWNRGARLAVAVDVGFFTSSDRLFGPRLLVRDEVRGYLLDGTFRPFVGLGVSAYHQFEVTIDFSDSSQRAGSSLGVGASLGHELVSRGGVSWVVELGLSELFASNDHAPDGLSWDVMTTLGYRF